MAKFLDLLPEIFRERYLETHDIYLKSIANIIAHKYCGEDWQDTCRNMIFSLFKASKMKRRHDVDEETPHFRNLRNCWYHECALNYPYTSRDERLLFAAWKIIQGYYVIFSSST